MEPGRDCTCVRERRGRNNVTSSVANCTVGHTVAKMLERTDETSGTTFFLLAMD
jgi:hypothetical protein